MRTLLQITKLAEDYKKQYENNEITTDEFIELIKDLSLSSSVNKISGDLEQDELCREVLIGISKIAGIIY